MVSDSSTTFGIPLAEGRLMRGVSVQRDEDQHLAACAASGDVTAQRQLVQRLMSRARMTAFYLAGDDADADDLAQLVLVEVLRSVGSFRGESRLETWVDRIATRTCMRTIKRQRAREAKEAPAGDAIVDRPSASPCGEEGASLSELRQQLARHLAHLAHEQRAALVLQLVYGYSLEEIADLVQAPKNTVRDRLRVGKLKLRSAVEKDPALRDWVARLGKRR